MLLTFSQHHLLHPLKLGGLARRWRQLPLLLLFEDAPGARPNVMVSSPPSRSFLCNPKRGSREQSLSLLRCQMNQPMRRSLQLHMLLVCKKLAGNWRLMLNSYLWMLLWGIHLKLQPLMQMFSVLLLYWVWQAPKFALCFWFLYSSSMQCNNVGLDLSVHFGHMALCVIWFVDLLKIFIYEYFM